MLAMSRSRNNKEEKGQSFVELSLVVVFLMIFVAGIVEFGFMLNNYLNLVDASREAVRYSSDYNPFIEDDEGKRIVGADGKYVVDTDFFTETGKLTQEVLAPVVLNKDAGDDIVISFFSVDLKKDIFIRYPQTAEGYWSVLGEKGTNFSDADMKSRMDSNAPPTGVLLIEIYYNYPQVLKLPLFTAFVRDPMPVYVYAIMPLAAAEP